MSAKETTLYRSVDSVLPTGYLNVPPIELVTLLLVPPSSFTEPGCGRGLNSSQRMTPNCSPPVCPGPAATNPAPRTLVNSSRFTATANESRVDEPASPSARMGVAKPEVTAVANAKARIEMAIFRFMVCIVQLTIWVAPVKPPQSPCQITINCKEAAITTNKMVNRGRFLTQNNTISNRNKNDRRNPKS